MLDRLLSGAGAISHLADRIVGGLLRGSNGAVGRVGVLLAIALAIGSAVGVWSAVENSGDRSMHSFSAGELATGDPGDRTYATVIGGVAPGYVESYQDINADGKQSPDETGEAWNYFVVDPATRAGVTVQSVRPPAEVFRYVAKGVVVDDPEYVAEDLTQFKDTVTELGVTLEPSRYIDATKTGSFSPHDLAAGVPDPGTAVEIDASRSIDYLPVCSADANGNGDCDDDEVDYWDLLLYDAASHQAVTVLTDSSPEFAPVSFSGLLRRSAERVTEAQRTDANDFSLEELGISVSPDYLLDEGTRPTDPLLPLGVAIAGALLAALIVIGTLGGTVRFRPDPPGLSGSPAAAMAPGERVPLHVTGVLRSAEGYVRARELPGDLVRFVLSSAGPPEVAPAIEVAPSPETTLIVERRGQAQGVAVGRGELTGLELGTAMLFRRPRPALRLRAGTGSLLVSFDDVAARDRAARELMSETGIIGGR